MVIFGVVLFSLGSVLFLFYFVKELQEVIFLKGILEQVNGKQKVESKDDLVNLKNYLNGAIKYDSLLRNKKRPMLRHTAMEVLKMNYGFCGENARVSIKLLFFGGIRANRIYLYGTKWGHVVVEQFWKGSWYLFDGHYDPKTKLEDDSIVAIKSDDLKSYPNGYSENAYIDFCRIKLFYKISTLKRWSKTRLPSLIIYYFESPYLIKASLGALISFVGIVLSYKAT